MISYILRTMKAGAESLRNHPQILFIVALLIIIPILFLYSGQQFLDAGRENQDKLQKDKIGILHDVVVSFMVATDFDVKIMQAEIERISRVNNDIKDFRVVSIEQGVVSPIAALDVNVIGKLEPFTDMFVNATVRQNESLIFEVPTDEGRVWLAYRAVFDEKGRAYVVYTKTSLVSVDQSFLDREHKAMLSLAYIFAFVIGLAYWHIKMTDYSYLYKREHQQNETKNTFINMMAHELRAPLTAIKGYAELLIEKVVDQDQKQYASRIDDSTERLLALVNDLLDVARLQSGQVSVTLGYVNVSEVITAVMNELSVTASEKQIQLLSKGIEAPHQAVADYGRLQQVLTNIVNNSIKYTEKGSIEIEVIPKRRTIEIRVKDTGMGIAATDQQKRFAPFFRVRSSDVEAITGTGLGMWITKQLVAIMGGTIAVESIQGVGTHVVVTLATEQSAPILKAASGV